MPLSITNLKKGDIMLKYHDGSIVSKAISLGQRIAGHRHINIVHAGILCDQVHIVESQGTGVVINNLLTGNNQYGYRVYRPTNSALGEGAGTGAKMFADIHKSGRALSYSIGGAVKSLGGHRSAPTPPKNMDDLMDRMLEGSKSPFFCSQFVVYIYQYAAEQSGIPAYTIFDMNAGKASPAALATVLTQNSSFSYIGELEQFRR